jgi:hypothetical protein
MLLVPETFKQFFFTIYGKERLIHVHNGLAL